VSQSSPQVQYVANVESYVMQHLRELMNQPITVQTSRGVVTGQLTMVHYDCIVVVKEGRTFIVRVAEIIWFSHAEGQ